MNRSCARAAKVDPVDLYLSGINLAEVEHALDERRFARAVDAGEPEK